MRRAYHCEEAREQSEDEKCINFLALLLRSSGCANSHVYTTAATTGKFLLEINSRPEVTVECEERSFPLTYPNATGNARVRVKSLTANHLFVSLTERLDNNRRVFMVSELQI